MPDKSDIFRKPSIKEITKGRRLVTSQGDVIRDLLSIDPEKEYLVIDGNIIPEKFFYKKDATGKIYTRTTANRKFMKHGPEIHFPTFNSIEEAVEAMFSQGKLPVHLGEMSFNTAKRMPYCGYSFRPIIGVDKRKRKVPLTEILEGAKLYTYSFRQPNPINVKPYTAERVVIDGGSAVVEVPSRTPGRGRYEFAIHSIPLVRNEQHLEYIVANGIISTHDCPDMRFRGIRFTYLNQKETSKIFNWDAHDIAAFFAVIHYFKVVEDNLVPLEMSQIPLPSQKLVNIYDLLRYNTVIFTRERSEQREKRLYPLNNAEVEILLHIAVQTFGHRATLHCDPIRDGKLRNYKWRTMQ